MLVVDWDAGGGLPQAAQESEERPPGLSIRHKLDSRVLSLTLSRNSPRERLRWEACRLSELA